MTKCQKYQRFEICPIKIQIYQKHIEFLSKSVDIQLALYRPCEPINLLYLVQQTLKTGFLFQIAI